MIKQKKNCCAMLKNLFATLTIAGLCGVCHAEGVHVGEVTVSSDYSATPCVVSSTLTKSKCYSYEVQVPAGKIAHVSFRRSYNNSNNPTRTEWNPDYGTPGYARVWRPASGESYDLSYDKGTVVTYRSDITSDTLFYLIPVPGSIDSRAVLIGTFELLGNKMPIYGVTSAIYYSIIYVQVAVTYEDIVPDLAVADLALSSAVASTEEDVTLSWAVRNVGNKTAGKTKVRIYDGETEIGTALNVSSLDAGRSQTFSVNLPSLAAGSHILCVRVTTVAGEKTSANNSASVTLRRYARVPVAVKFDAQGGEGGETRQVLAGNAIGSFPSVKKEGYALKGWSSDASTMQSVSASLKVFDPMTVYAIWAPIESAVSLNRQFGSNGTVALQVSYDATPSRISVPTRLGYVFGGYWTKLNGEGVQIYGADGTGVRRWNIATSNVTLYAKWDAARTTVVLDVQGGSGGTDSVVMTYEAPLPDIRPPARSDWNFNGYFSATNGTGTQYYDSTGSGVRVWDMGDASFVRLYADWLPKQMTYTVVLDSQSGALGSPSVVVTYRDVPSKITPPRRAQYVFRGYFSEPNGGGVQYYDSEGYGLSAWNEAQVSKRLYAKWEKAYHVILDANDGTGRTVTEYFETNVWQLAQCPYARTGFVLAGWSFASSGIPELADGAIVNKKRLGYGDNPDAVEVRLYAMWGKKIQAKSLKDFAFVTGGEGNDPYWSEEDGSLRNGRSSGISWLVRRYDRPAELDWTVAQTNMGVASDCSFAIPQDDRMYTNVISRSQKTATDSVIVPFEGGNAVWWSCRKLASSLRTGLSDADDLSALDKLCTAKRTAFSQKRSILISKISQVVKGTSCIERGVDATMESYRQKLIRQESPSIDVTVDEMCSAIASAGGNVKDLRLAIANSSWLGIEIKNTMKDVCGLANGILNLDAFLNDRMCLVRIDETVCYRIGFSLGRISGQDEILEWRSVAKGKSVGSLPEPTRKGSVFAGWWTAENGGSQISQNSVLSTDAIVYAHWRVQTYIATFDANGGNGGEERVVSSGERIGELPLPTRAGYVFSGWYNGSQVASPFDVISGNVTWKAVWTRENDWECDLDAEEYLVRFISAKGSGAMTAEAVGGNKVYRLPTCRFSNVGKRFAGWACSNDRRYDDGCLVFNLAKPGETVTMTAIWDDDQGDVSTLSRGLVAHYPLNGNANDVGVYGNHGTIDGATATADRHGNANSAMYFDGKSWICAPSIPALANLSKSATVATWVKFDADSTAYNWYVLCRGETSCSLGLCAYNMSIASWSINGRTDLMLTGTAAPELGQWTHVAMTLGDGVLSLYVNGKLSASQNVGNDASLPIVADAPLYIGKDPPGNVEYCKGALDEIRIYNRALSAEEIQMLAK